MLVQEVSLVDVPANLRKFVITKRTDMPPSQTTKLTLKLPSDAKQGIMDGLSQCLDKATALATMVGDADVDDQATVPAELAAALDQIGDMFEGMAQQYGSAPETAPAASAEGAPAGNMTPDTSEAPGAASSAGKSLTKGLPPEFHDGDSITTELHDGDSLAQVFRKGIAVGQLTLAKMEKAGRKMAAARYNKLSELHDALGKLLNELAYDETAATGAQNDKEPNPKPTKEEEATGKAKKPPAPPGKPPVPNPPTEQEKAYDEAVLNGGTPSEVKTDGKTPKVSAPPKPNAVDVVNGGDFTDVKTTTSKTLAEVLELAKTTKAMLTDRIATLEKTVSTVAKAHGVSNAGSVEGGGPLTTEVRWAPDMSAEIKQRKAKAAAK
jgi:hypothetical protein